MNFLLNKNKCNNLMTEIGKQISQEFLKIKEEKEKENRDDIIETKIKSRIKMKEENSKDTKSSKYDTTTTIINNDVRDGIIKKSIWN